MAAEATIRQKFRALAARLDEHTRRVWAATEASALGYGGISLVERATHISRRAILVGLREIRAGDILPEGRIRRPGGGRKSAVHHQPDLPKKLEGLVEPLTRGDPMSPLRWSCKSTRRLSRALKRLGYSASSRIVAILLRGMGYSLQGNCKTIEGKQHPDRNAEHINARVTAEMRAAQPVISVDTKKKELVGNYVNRGKQWIKKGPPKVNGHDFPDPMSHAPTRTDLRTDATEFLSMSAPIMTPRPLLSLLSVGGAGMACLSRETSVDHGRCRWKQRLPPALVEMGTPTVCG